MLFLYLCNLIEGLRHPLLVEATELPTFLDRARHVFGGRS